ncbi:MAG: hypothetical protein RLZZ600_726 [Actinomycetota bacterium]|jgi:hypothetical protein
MATFTTVKVSTETRDRLKIRAEEGNFPSIDAYLEDLIAREDRAKKIAEFRDVMSRVTPEEWADYMAEVASMDGSLSDGLDPKENWDDEWADK